MMLGDIVDLSVVVRNLDEAVATSGVNLTPS